MAGMFANQGTVILGKVNSAPVDGFIDIRIDRQTILGNKFPKEEFGGRNNACDLYEKWAIRRMTANGKYAQRIKKLRALYKAGQSIRLLCHCHPKRCHGLTVRKLIIGIL